MNPELQQWIVLGVTVLLIVTLYKEWLHPALTFFIATGVLLAVGILKPSDALAGLSNQQIIIIFMLTVITAGIRRIYGPELFAALFKDGISDRRFLWRMMMLSSGLSTFVNNTPIVAFMLPYVKGWAEKNGRPASKFLIPLSYATILGGMVTVIGTSTNLVLNGLIDSYKLPELGFTDFFYLGLLVTLAGWLFLQWPGFGLLPAHESQISHVRESLTEYMTETVVYPGSPIAGKSVRDAGLRQLKDAFLVEIVRGDMVISPVPPETVLQEGDLLFFSGNTNAILRLIREDNGLHASDVDFNEQKFTFIEAVVPANADLIGQRIKDTDFRKRFNASIIAVHRNGKKVTGRVGETVIEGGDFMLLLGDEKEMRYDNRHLVIVSRPDISPFKNPWYFTAIGIACLGLLLVSIVGLLPLFSACLIALGLLVAASILPAADIRKELDLSLLLILVSSLAIGVALEKSGAASLLAKTVISVGMPAGPAGVIAALFVATVFLTNLITNAAAVSIVFPIAMSVSTMMGLPTTPFFACIAFAASCSFMTPIGYQTNLMVYGPGGYRFRDFVRVGGGLTILYSLICIVFITLYYDLV